MPARTDSFDLSALRLTSGEGRRLELEVAIDDFTYGAQRYAVDPGAVPVVLEISRTTGSGYALRLRFEAAVRGPCMRCLDEARPALAVDAREVQQPGGSDELRSPYVADGELDVRRWAHDALALAMPQQVVCHGDCAGLCAVCGENLNDNPHEHEREPDPRWAKLSELRFE